MGPVAEENLLRTVGVWLVGAGMFWGRGSICGNTKLGSRVLKAWGLTDTGGDSEGMLQGGKGRSKPRQQEKARGPEDVTSVEERLPSTHQAFS